MTSAKQTYKDGFQFRKSLKPDQPAGLMDSAFDELLADPASTPVWGH